VIMTRSYCRFTVVPEARMWRAWDY